MPPPLESLDDLLAAYRRFFGPNKFKIEFKDERRLCIRFHHPGDPTVGVERADGPAAEAYFSDFSGVEAIDHLGPPSVWVPRDDDPTSDTYWINYPVLETSKTDRWGRHVYVREISMLEHALWVARKVGKFGHLKPLPETTHPHRRRSRRNRQRKG